MSKQHKVMTVMALVVTLIAGSSIAWLAVSRSGEDSVVDRVGEHYLLPAEEPTVATVEDDTKLTSDFLRSAKNGDRLLIYQDAKKVILYRPSIDRIIEVGPVSIAAPARNTAQ